MCKIEKESQQNALFLAAKQKLKLNFSSLIKYFIQENFLW